jgi:hypothetical protein
MALDLNGLTAYVQDEISPILSTALLSPKFTDYVTTWEGVKSSIRIPTLESTVPFQASATCADATTSGTTTLADVTLTTSPIEFTESICLLDLEAYKFQKLLPKGATYDTASIVTDIVKRKMALVALQIEQMFFQGKTTYTNSTVLKQINGLISKIDTAGTAQLVTAQASISTSTIRTIVEEFIFSKIPSAVLDQSIIAMGQDSFRILLNKLMTDNAFNYFPAGNETSKWELTYPGSNTKIVAFAGLNNNTSVDSGSLPTAVKNRIISFRKEDVHYGVDLNSDSTDTEVWYEQKERKIYIRGRFRAGVVGSYYTQMAQYTNS